jgi:hypothetical protein
MMGGIVHKYFPECYQFDEAEMNMILVAAFNTDGCKNAIANIKRLNGLPLINCQISPEIYPIFHSKSPHCSKGLVIAKAVGYK